MDDRQYEPSRRERQFALSMLAHAARRDDGALEHTLRMIGDPAEGLRGTHILAALLGQFQEGMDAEERVELAEFYTAEAETLARIAADVY